MMQTPRLLLVLCTLLFGCAAQPTQAPEPAPPEVRIDDIASRLPAPGLEAVDKSPKAALVVHVLELPADYDLTALWADPEALEQEREAMPDFDPTWRDNGVRAAVVPLDRFRQWRQSLPARTNHSRRRMVAGQMVTPLRLLPPLGGALPRGLALHLGSQTRVEPVPGGRFQLLIQARPVATGAHVVLTPHRYKPEPSLTPRQPMEKAIDGRVFEELALSRTLAPGGVLVLAPWDAPSDRDASEQAEPDEDDQAPPWTVGQLTLRGRRAGRPVKLLVLITPEAEAKR